MSGAGIIFKTPDNLALFMKRGADGDHPGTWAWPGGGIEDGETAEEAARRETLEETGYSAEGELSPVDGEATDESPFTTFHHGVDEPFLPKLNGEHTAFTWAPLSDPPVPLHPGVESTLNDIHEDDAVGGVTNDCYAFDRASVRREDKDGRLHLDTTNISKANVCPYLGKEIPDWQKLGLQPDKIYYLYRDPEELAKAAPTFNNLPVLSEHVETNSSDHKPELIIGTTGTHAEFKHPFLKNSMAFWTDQAKDDIETERKKQLSSAYRYRADMTPGTSPEGNRYDGVMRDIIGNHVALVEEGRAGPDVVVGDSIEELRKMGKIKVSQKAQMARGALAVFLQPKLAKDAKLPSLTTLLLGVNAKNFAEKKTSLATAITKAMGPTFAKDNAEGLKTLLDSLGSTPVQDDMDPEDDMVLDAPGTGESDDPGVVPVEKPDPMEAIMAFLENKLSPEDIAQVKQLCGAEGGAQDDPPDFKGKPEVGGKMVGDGKEDDVTDKPLTPAAMDAAIDKARKETLAEANKVNREIRDAERAVKPYIGEVTKAFDSASEVYKSALEALKVDIKDVHPSAYPAMLRMLPVIGEKKPTPQANMGMDSSQVSNFHTRFKNAARIGNL